MDTLSVVITEKYYTLDRLTGNKISRPKKDIASTNWLETEKGVGTLAVLRNRPTRDPGESKIVDIEGISEEVADSITDALLTDGTYTYTSKSNSEESSDEEDSSEDKGEEVDKVDQANTKEKKKPVGPESPIVPVK